MKRGLYYLKTVKNINQCVKLWIYCVHLFQKQTNYKKNIFWYIISKCINLFYKHISKFNLCYLIDIFNDIFLKEIMLSDRIKCKIKNMCIAMQFTYILWLKLNQYSSNNDNKNIQNTKDYIKITILARRLLSLNLRGNNGLTLFHICCGQSPIKYNHDKEPPNVEFVQFLLDVGADPSIQDFSGNTPLHYITYYMNKNDKINTWQNIVNILLKYGAHFDAKNVYGHTFNSLQNIIHLKSIYYTSLQCISANAIRKYEKQGYKYTIPTYFLNFVNIH